MNFVVEINSLEISYLSSKQKKAQVLLPRKYICLSLFVRKVNAMATSSFVNHERCIAYFAS